MPCALPIRSEEHTSELQSHDNLVCRLLLEKKNNAVTVRRAAARPLASRGPAPAGSLRDHSVGVRGRAARVRHLVASWSRLVFFFFNDTAPPEIYPLPLHDALPICNAPARVPPMPLAYANANGSAPPEASCSTATRHGTPRPSTYWRRTRGPGPVGATIATSTFAGGVM